MDLQEKRQLELATHVAKMRTRTRPWRSIIALVLALAAGAVASAWGADFHSWFQRGHVVSKIVTLSATGAFCLFAVIALIGMSGKARDILQPVTGTAHAAVVRYSIALIGGVAALIITLGLVKVPIGRLVVGGAVTTIIIGIAAQASLANVFAGIVLLLSRPFAVGDRIRLRSGAFGGQIEGAVTEIGIIYVRIATAEGPLHLPNAQVLAAAVGPFEPFAAAETDPAAATRPPDQTTG